MGGRECEEWEDTTTAGGTAAVFVVGQSDEEEESLHGRHGRWSWP